MNSQWKLRANAEYRNSSYLDDNIQSGPGNTFTVDRRNDDRIMASLRGGYLFAREISLFGEYRYTNNDSNFDRYSYSSNQFMLGVEKSF